ncbi:suppressor of fused domain protein [Acidiferrimicrobium sp. IK]|uniref:suppressor of fused domain protein n=1 Tax=Acidiferrimicrobium sp. IK TaxID=2871700 RepID=UPI0021CB2669|nr:suppressor of fused domain protein [Acidiferrimicrobium sp. IK]MCU4184886.1 suppressor of fused domain protein [Acidiferrimicrobium sp. IK]
MTSSERRCGEGTAALDEHVDRVDGGPAAHRWTPRPAHTRRGDPPLEEVTAHRVGDPDHWHLVTYGLSELHRPDPADVVAQAPPGDPDAALSGWGFELTLRLAGSDEEPLWAVDLLTNLAAYVWAGGHPFAAGHHLDLRGPIRLDSESALTAAVVVTDPTLGVMDGPLGTVELLQVVGLTADELELCRSWSTDAVVDLLARDNPLLVTDIARRSVLADPGIAGEVAARARADGSELTELRVATLAWHRARFGRRAVVEMGSGTAAALGPALRRELVAPGAAFSVVGDEMTVRFVVADTPGWHGEGPLLVVDVPPEEVDGVAGLFDGRAGWGSRPALPGLRVHVKA